MEIDYPYTKLRGNFGKQCIFCEDGPKVLEDLKSDKTMMDKYIYKNPVNKASQVGCVRSENHANTHIKDYSDRGMNHLEGGWPREIDTNDEEAVLRFRKKTERLDNYVAALKNLSVPMEHAILQNNAVNIYEQYFVGTQSALPTEQESCRIQSVFRDPKDVKRPINHCTWSPEGTEFAVAHCNTDYQRMNPDQSFESYVWDLENPNKPLVTFEPDYPILTLEYNPKDSRWLAAGLYNGQLALFDTRKGQKHVALSVLESSHRDPAHSVLWVASKSGMEFFSTSNDGIVKWWDCRKLDHPVDHIILDLTKGDKPSITRANSSSCLEFEPSIPVKYMVGTETGYIISGNRKGTTHQEKLPWIMKAHSGPIYSIHRNQSFTKNFLSVGDWVAKVWSEDCKESPIIWTKNHKTRLTAGEWSAARLSVFFLTREDGVLDLYDILLEQKEAFLSLKLCDCPLTSLRVREDGVLLVAGNSLGTAYVVRFPSYLADTSKNEKVFLSALFDRESRREKLLETRNKEIKLRMREIALAKEAAETEDKGPKKTEFDILVENYRDTLESQYLGEVETGLKEYEKRREFAKTEAVVAK